MIDPEIKETIDKMTYEDMLRRLRFSPTGDPIFVIGDTVEYFFKIMKEKEKDVDKVAISKKVGWNNKNFNK